MIYEEHNRPGEAIMPLSQDAAFPFYAELGLTDDPEEARLFQAVFRAAVTASGFGPPAAVWEATIRVAPQMLSVDRATRLLQWLHDAYTYHPANPDMAWGSILLRFARGAGGWPDVGQTLEEQRQFDEFANFFLQEWDRDSFDTRVEAEQEKPPTDWDREVHMRYGLVPLDDDGKDSLPFLRSIHKGAALRRAIRGFDFAARPGFPHERMRAAGQLAASQGWMPPGTPLGHITEVS